jgi:two-component system cell cycle sensor histidine kinase/response regulator CckA
MKKKKKKESLKILIAEDHNTLRSSIRDLVETHLPGTHCFEVSNGKEAVSIAIQNEPDIILMDINMPEMDGLKATRRIKEVLPQTQIVMLTIHENHEYKSDAATSGASAYVYKRKMATTLIDVVKGLIRREESDNILPTTEEISFIKDTLKEGEVKYRTLIESSTNCIMLYDCHGHCLTANNACQSLLNCSVNDFIGKNFVDVWPEEEQSKVVKHMQKVLEGERSVFDVYKVDGEEKRWWNISMSPIRDESDIVDEFLVIGADITDRKSAEDELTKSEKRFRELAELLPEAIFETDSDGQLTYANNNAFKYFGYTKDEFINQSCFKFLTPKDHKRAKENFQRILNGEDIGLNEYTAMKKDGTTFPAMLHSSAIVHEGERVGIRGFVMDVTQQKKLEEQLLHSQKMESVGQLAGGIAHDFNNILTAIQGFSNTLKIKMLKSDPLHSYVDNILSSADKAASLTQRLLTFSRKQIIKPIPIDLNKVIENIEPLLSELAHKDIRLRLELCKEKVMVCADAGQIEQVLMNLVTNARDAMPQRGDLTITTGAVEVNEALARTKGFGEPGCYACMSVKDTGSGISKEIMKEIFEPYFTTKEAGRGTGLGLSMVYGIVKQHKGHIAVYSDEGQGTRFSIYLPEMVDECEEDHNRLGKSIPDKGSETILIADDEEMIRKMTKQIFEEFGYTVYEACNGKEAIDIFKDHKNEIDLMIIDVIMPGINGMQVYDEVKDVSPHTKILLTSGYDKGMLKEIPANSDVEVITKPFSTYRIMGKIREIFDNDKKRVNGLSS